MGFLSEDHLRCRCFADSTLWWFFFGDPDSFVVVVSTFVVVGVLGAEPLELGVVSAEYLEVGVLGDASTSEEPTFGDVFIGGAAV